MSEAVGELLKDWLRRQLPGDKFVWLEGELAKLAKGQQRDLDMLFGLAPRKLGRADLDLSADDLIAAGKARVGLDPRFWTIDEAARILALLAFAAAAKNFAEAFMSALPHGRGWRGGGALSRAAALSGSGGV